MPPRFRRIPLSQFKALSPFEQLAYIEQASAPIKADRDPLMFEPEADRPTQPTATPKRNTSTKGKK